MVDEVPGGQAHLRHQVGHQVGAPPLAENDDVLPGDGVGVARADDRGEAVPVATDVSLACYEGAE
ncbi:hypothetical protein D3C83_259670 [compost metagenome]